MGITSTEWRRQVLEYASDVNAYVARGLTEGWEAAGSEPVAPALADALPTVLAALREANARGDWAAFREAWPPAHEPLIPWLESHGRSIPVVRFLRDGSLLVRVGAPHDAEARTIQLDGNAARPLPTVGFFGTCPRRRFFAIARADGVEVREGLDGTRRVLCPWPRGTEGVPSDFTVEPIDGPHAATQLVVFPGGDRVLMSSEYGTFVMTANGATRLGPTAERMRSFLEWNRDENPGEIATIGVSMQHCAVSHDGSLIAVGDQDSQHCIYDAELRLLCEIAPGSEYPHYACFSADDSVLALNACHFYSGLTLGVRTADLRAGADEVPTIELEDGARVYAAAVRGDQFLIGDASGYVRAFDLQGRALWQHFVGSTVGDIDVSTDGRTMAVSTYAGFVSIVRLDAGRRQPYQIGTGEHYEERRWIFWKDEAAPLIW